MIKPFLDDLPRRGIAYQYQPHLADNYYDHYNFCFFGPLPEGWVDYVPFAGSCIVPRSMIIDPDQNQVVRAVLRNASFAEGYAPMVCHVLDVL